MRPVRRTQIISPWGIGAMVNFRNDESLMTCGLDAWPWAKEECPAEFKVIEERLQALLGVDHFRLPPDFRRSAPGVQHPHQKIPFVLFPRWHYCHHCGNMRELGLFGALQKCDAPNFESGQSCQKLPERRRPRLMPIRFVAVCSERGHIQDFPFMEWVHRAQPPAPDCRLRLRAGRSAAGLHGIKIQCSCNQSRTMAGAFNNDALEGVGVYCGGQRPWLGDTVCSVNKCGRSLQVLQRGASNIYFAHVASSIYLPLWGEKATRRVVEVIEDPKVWNFLSSGLVDGKIDQIRCEAVAELKMVDLEDLLEAAQQRLDDVQPEHVEADESEVQYRYAEYEALRTGRGAAQTDLYTTTKSPSEYEKPFSDFFVTVTLVHKLRETRAFYGFSRYLPEDTRQRSEKITDLRLDPRINWLPAVAVQGEGIFFELKSERLQEWMENAKVLSRINLLADNLSRTGRPLGRRAVTPKFVLLHTLAHLLINQLSFECGYGSSSLRERIYCDVEDSSQPMNGILIYTASGDSEGTTGGLVRQGNVGRLERTLVRAFRTASWCSSDPICMESRGQGPDSCNLAACHGCALLPETSCEEGNRLLDRVMVVGLPDSPEIGLFGKFLQNIS